jgi:hypothetical protein
VSAIATSGGSVFQHFFSRTGAQLREATVTSKEAEQPPARPGEFTEGTVYRARVGSWKRPVLAAALVFGVTMTGITVYELVSGDSFSGGKGTTVSAAVTGHDTSSSPKSGDRAESGRFPVRLLERLVGRPGDVIRLDRRRHTVQQRWYVVQSDADAERFGRRRYADPHAQRVGY